MTGFCGQDCTFCTYRNTHGCGGCRETQGNPFYGPCRVARCCSVKGLESCSLCRDQGDCALAERMREQRESWQPGPETPPGEDGSSFKIELLGQWLPVLFWMLIASTVVSLGQNLGERAAELTSWIMLGISVAMLYVFWKLSAVSRHLRLVWWLQVAGVVLSVVTLLLQLIFPVEENTASIPLYLTILLPMLVLEALVPYYFCEGLARELDAVGEWSLGRQWREAAPVPPGGHGCSGGDAGVGPGSPLCPGSGHDAADGRHDLRPDSAGLYDRGAGAAVAQRQVLPEPAPKPRLRLGAGPLGVRSHTYKSPEEKDKGEEAPRTVLPPPAYSLKMASGAGGVPAPECGGEIGDSVMNGPPGTCGGSGPPPCWNNPTRCRTRR